MSAADARQDARLAAVLARVEPGFALFSVPGWRREKLQVLRWLMHDRHEAGDFVSSLLRRALGDDDWELRATSMLAAARLKVDDLAVPIARLALPSSVHQGVTASEQRLLLALRDAALERLGHGRGRRLPAGVAAAVAGDLSSLPMAMAAFAHALSEPLPDEAPPPVEARGVVFTGTGPQLSDGGLLAWVPPVAHWLGDDELRHALPNPVRRHPPERGFYIDAQPRGQGTPAQARAAAQALADRLGRPVALPSADEWEMAARGPDGRRFPWGMNAEPSARSDLSPWGVAGIAKGVGEWVEAGSSGGSALAVGGAESIGPARRCAAGAGEIRNYRFVFR